MSFTTRCPACGTVFRVVADQLKISDGWVRCGHCSDVFDATINLQAWVAPASAASTAPPAPAAPVQAVERPEPVAPMASAVVPPAAPVLVSPEPVWEPTPEPVFNGPATGPAMVGGAEEVPADDDLRAWFGDGPLEPAGASSAPPLPVEPESALDQAEGPAEPIAEAPPSPAIAAPLPEATQPAPEHETTPEPEPEPEPDVAFRAELERFAQARASAPVAALPASAREDAAAQPVSVASSADDDGPDAEAGAVPEFVRQARRRARWTSPGVRVGLVALALLLAAVLAAQWALQQRHRLVVEHPLLRPWIEQACAHLGCDLAPLRRIDAVEIESAELVRRLGDFYSFDFVLRNRSTLEVAVPALELTLTGLGERAVARRVFLPQDWPDAPASIPAGGRVSVSLRLALTLGDDVPTAGYRALVFYP